MLLLYINFLISFVMMPFSTI